MPEPRSMTPSPPISSDVIFTGQKGGNPGNRTYSHLSSSYSTSTSYSCALSSVSAFHYSIVFSFLSIKAVIVMSTFSSSLLNHPLYWKLCSWSSTSWKELSWLLSLSLSYFLGSDLGWISVREKVRAEDSLVSRPLNRRVRRELEGPCKEASTYG